MKYDRKGKVYLVGAGPGDPGLITVRGAELMRAAEVIIYDYLAAKQILQLARSDAELIYVGKKGSEHTLGQEGINQLMVDRAREGKMVVRLKGGDPFVFGRGAEEAQELVRAGLEWEMVPGVTSGVAAPAYAGIPVTHRDFASDLALITGQEDAGRTGESQIDWEALGKWKGTLVFYMGVKNLSIICDNLIRHGMSVDMPAALIAWGTTVRQRTLTGTVGTLGDLAQQYGFAPPAIILIGKVVLLREQLQWFEKRPLFGKRIVVTRSRAQASELVERLKELGADILECPTIRVEQSEDVEPLREAINCISEYHWVIFTSVNGVDGFFQALLAEGHDARCLSRAQVCVIGPATAQRLREHGIVAELIPERFVAESILEALSQTDDLKGKRVLLARADIARADLPEGLSKLGAMVDEVTAYRTVVDDSARDELIEALGENSVDWITFTSSSTVRNLLSQVGLDNFSQKKFRIASIGPVTSATIKKMGLKVDVQAEEYTIAGLIRALLQAENI